MSSIFLEFFTLIYILINIKGNIFYSEVIYILNFAFYYLYLHFTPFHEEEITHVNS